MAIKTNVKTFSDILEKEANRRATEVLRYNLAYIGEMCVNKARSLPSPPESMRGKPHTPNYIDDTNNLRSSIGYIIVINGSIMQPEGFNGMGSDGAEHGKDYALNLAEKQPNNIAVLIVVAGERYAKYVSDRGFDVLDSANIVADKLINQLLR